MSTTNIELRQILQSQASFAAATSPLYHQIFQVLADWVERDPDDPVVKWLANLTEVRRPLELSLLIPAALHRGVLAGEPILNGLARYYPSVGGNVPDAAAGLLAPVLHQALLDAGPAMEPFLREATVQTNETARGLAWLLPLTHTHWPAVHLLELGASAGLNLLADWRSYRLVDESQSDSRPVDIGRGRPIQFTNHFSDSPIKPLTAGHLPQIISRVGLDLAPFPLRNEAEEQLLTSFVWADQTARIDRLREGIAALHASEAIGQAPELHAVRLPDQLRAFLDQWSPQPSGYPVVIYNTIVTMYLDGGAAVLKEVVSAWAATQSVPVLWLQWEPPVDAATAPEWGWSAWTADLWLNGLHREFDLARVHPHAANLQWLPGLAQWTGAAT